MSDDLLPFLDLETGFENLILPGWELESRKVVKKAVRALERGYDNEAQQALDQLSMDAVIRRAQGKAKQLAVTAMLYGARNCSKKADGTSFEDEIGWGMDRALEAFFGMVGPVLEKHARTAARDEIDTIAWELKNEHLGEDGGQIAVQKADQAWIDRLNKAVDKGGVMMSGIASNLTTSRLISYGFLSEATVRKVTRYRLNVTMDTHTSKICKSLKGKTFEVSTAYSFLKQVLQITDPDALKTAHPWLKADKATLEDLRTRPNTELQDKYGVMVPPFHPHCRTTLEKGPELEDVAYSESFVPAPATLKVSRFKERELEVEVVDVSAGRYEQPDIDRMVSLTKKIAGVFPNNEVTAQVRVTKFGIRLQVFDSDSEDFWISRTFYRNEGSPPAIRHDFFELPDRMQGGGYAKDVLGAGLESYQEMGVEEIVLQANISVGGYAWARAGFVPRSPEDFRWYMNERLLTKALPEEDYRLVKTLIDTTPAETLAYDLAKATLGDRKIGKELLLGAKWEARMDLTQPAQVARLKKFIGD